DPVKITGGSKNRWNGTLGTHEVWGRGPAMAGMGKRGDPLMGQDLTASPVDIPRAAVPWSDSPQITNFASLNRTGHEQEGRILYPGLQAQLFRNLHHRK